MTRIRIIAMLVFSLTTLYSCKEKTPQEIKVANKNNDKAAIENKIKALEDEMFDKNNAVKDIRKEKEKANELLGLYTKFYNLYSEDSKGGDYLFKAGNIALGLGQYRPAIQAFRNAHDAFPSYRKRIEAVYMVGFIYDNELNQKNKARQYYQFVIDNYPENKLAKDAQARLETLDLTDEELIKLFEKKNAKK